MLQWFLRFPEFAEFSERSAPFRENPIVSVPVNTGESNLRIHYDAYGYVPAVNTDLLIYFIELSQFRKKHGNGYHQGNDLDQDQCVQTIYLLNYKIVVSNIFFLKIFSCRFWLQALM